MIGAGFLWPALLLATSVSIDLPVQPGIAEQGPVEIFVEWTCGESESQSSQIESVLSPSVISLPLSAPGPCEAKVSSEGFWASPRRVTTALAEGLLALGRSKKQPPEPYSLEPLIVWTTGRLSSTLAMKAELKEPLGIRASFQPGSDHEAEEGLAGNVPCLLSERTLVCELPAARLDVRLKVEGFVPVYLWDVSVESGQVNDLGSLALRRGSSITGWVETDSKEPVPKDAEVALLPPPNPNLGPTSRKRIDQQTHRAKVTDRGFFQLSGVPPGKYRVVAQAGELIPAVLETLVVNEGSEATISDPLVLEHPLKIEVVIEPLIGPTGTPWLLSLSAPREGPYLSPDIARGPVDPEGRWQVGGLRSGTYVVSVATANHRWFQEEIEARRDGEQIHLEIPLKPVRGEVLLRGEPLEASLVFGGKNGRVRIPVETDEAGSFEAVLPRWGSWPLSVSSEDPRVERRFRRVEVLETDEGGEGYLVVELGEASIAGVVLDEEGREAPGAIISALFLPEVEPVRVRSGDKGGFNLEGLGEASVVTLQAFLGDAQSRSVRIDLEGSEGSEDVEPFELVLKRSLEVEGVVLGPHGVIPGATVVAWPTGTGYSEMTATNESGAFLLRMSPRVADVGAADFVVMAPGYGLSVQRRPVRLGEPLSVMVESATGGELLLPLAAPESPGLQMPVLLHNGIPLALPFLMQWARVNGLQPVTEDRKRLRAPLMPTGVYELCTVGMAQLSNQDAVEPGEFEGCVRGVLLGGSTLDLRWPAAPDTGAPPATRVN